MEAINTEFTAGFDYRNNASESNGTLYGRNTIAGATKINSAARGDNGANVAVSIGDNGYRKIKGGFSYGINDSSGLIISALNEESDGYVTAGAFGKQGGKDVTALRVAYDKDREKNSQKDAHTQSVK